MGNSEAIGRSTGRGSLKNMCIGSCNKYDFGSQSEHCIVWSEPFKESKKHRILTKLYVVGMDGHEAHWNRVPTMNCHKSVSKYLNYAYGNALAWLQLLHNMPWFPPLPKSLSALPLPKNPNPTTVLASDSVIELALGRLRLNEVRLTIGASRSVHRCKARRLAWRTSLDFRG